MTVSPPVGCYPDRVTKTGVAGSNPVASRAAISRRNNLEAIMDNGDYDKLIESYLPAAQAAGLTRADVELALSIACRFLERCESCRHSRAPHDAVKVAEDQGRLEIYRRSCSFRRPTGNGCQQWERLEVPELAEVVA